MRLPVLAVCAAVLWSADPASVRLWEKGAPGWEDRPDRQSVQADASGQRRVRNVTRPALEVFLPPPESANGSAVVICPGGGYVVLACDKEGADVARWLNGRGIAAFVLSYRLIPTPDAGTLAPEERARLRRSHPLTAMEDGKRALRLVRYRAAEWKVDPKRVALMGFSAGGHLAANVAMHYDQGSDSAVDPVDRLGCRPDALIAIYPGHVINPVFKAGAPPAFILHANDDATVPAEHSAELYTALKQAGVPAELHIFAKGGHGFGMLKANRVIDQWPERLGEWLHAQGWSK